MKKLKLIKEYIEVHSYEVKEYISHLKQVIVKRKKIDVLRNNIFQIKNYKSLVSKKESSLMVAWNFIKELFKKIKLSINLLSFFSLIFFVLMLMKVNDINDRFNQFDGKELFKINQELKTELKDQIELLQDSLRNFDFELEKKLKKFNLIENQIYWENMQLKNYSYLLKGGACFIGYKYDITVSNGKVQLIKDQDGREVSNDQFVKDYGFTPTIKEIFNVFHKILAVDNPEYYNINYDSYFKYPSSAFFDYSSCSLDEEGCWEISNFDFGDKNLLKNKFNSNNVAVYSFC